MWHAIENSLPTLRTAEWMPITAVPGIRTEVGHQVNCARSRRVIWIGLSRPSTSQVCSSTLAIQICAEITPIRKRFASSVRRFVNQQYGTLARTLS